MAFDSAEDYEWNASESTVTAWSAAATKASKGRRAYGRHAGSRKIKLAGRNNKKGDQQKDDTDATGSMSSNTIELMHALSNSKSSRSQVDDNIRVESRNVEAAGPAEFMVKQTNSINRRFSIEADKSSAHVIRQHVNGSNVSASEENENLDPHASPHLKELSSPQNQPPTKLKKVGSVVKTKAIHGENSYHRNPGCSPKLAPSFSDLAQSGEICPSWVNDKVGFSPSENEARGIIDSQVIGYAPPGSSESLRRRGVCASPLNECEDETSSSSSSARPRAHMSPPVLTRTKLDTDKLMKRRGGMNDNASDSKRREARSSREGVSANTSLESTDDTNSEDEANEIIAPGPISRFTPDSSSSIFAAFDGSWTPSPNNASAPTLVGSCEHIAFLVEALQKEKTNTSMASFGSRSNWTVVPPSFWSPDRRSAFLQWATKDLGFSYRVGDGSFSFIQITPSRGATVLQSLLLQQSSEEPIGEEFEQIEAGMQSMNISGSRDTFDKPSLTFIFDDEINQKGPSSGDHHGQNVLCGFQSRTSFPRKSSDNVERACRLSSDHRVSGLDLLQHLHALSPKVGPNATPVLISRGTPQHGDCNSILPGRCNSNFSRGDIVETPMVKRTYVESTPRQGKDWGTSVPCTHEIIKKLLKRLPAPSPPSSSLFEPMSVNSPPSSSTGSSSESLSFQFETERDCKPDNERERRISSCSKSLQDSPSTPHFADFSFNQSSCFPSKMVRRRAQSLAKHKRVSMCAPEPSRLDTSCCMSPFNTSFANLAIQPGTIEEETSSKRKIMFALPVSTKSSGYDPKTFEVLANVFSYLSENELLCSVSLVCTAWADTATETYASLMLMSLDCSQSFFSGEESGIDSKKDKEASISAYNSTSSIARSMERSWNFLNTRFPWGTFLAEGAFKSVYKVYNSSVETEEALSVMNVNLIDSTGNKGVIGAELAVSVMLSSLARRNICPNFLVTRGVFTCPFPPPAGSWGSADNKNPKGKSFVSGNKLGRKPREPSAKKRGQYQYIRTELCNEGDAEEYLKRQPDEAIEADECRTMIFQIAFALYAAQARFNMKHYDVKLLNIFLQDANIGVVDKDERHCTVMRYGVGNHVYSLRMATHRAILAKLADYGTANVQAETDGQPVSLAQFTTIENTPPDFFIVGDAATQGCGHDCYGLGLCMLHLFTGHAPYEEILEDVHCPLALKNKLKRIWEDARSVGYDTLRAVIFADLSKEEIDAGDYETDGVFYDTLYRYFVLFGIPKEKFLIKECGKVWHAVSSLESTSTQQGASAAATQFENDRSEYSLSHGSNKFIARAREKLQMIDGGMDLLLSLVSSNPSKRASILNVLNSDCMRSLREEEDDTPSNEEDIIYSFMAFSTPQN